MEEGSLLQEALEHAKTLRTASAHDSLLTNCVFLDLYSLGTGSGTARHDNASSEDDVKINANVNVNVNEEPLLIYLARLAGICNRFFRSKAHSWHYGADGPVFGIHLDPNLSESESIPHIRAYCRYGPSVQDSWMAVRYVRELFQFVKDDHREGVGDIAASIWDVQDGQLLLIQLADLLPPWLDEDSTDNHRHAVWIDPDGNLQLLRTPHIGLTDALQDLKNRREAAASTSNRSSSHPKLQEALMYWLELNNEAASVNQRAPMVLPRNVARVFRERPELLRTSIQAFCEHLHQDGNGPVVATHELEIDFTHYNDWVWTVQTLSRTNYAMARTVASSRGDWTSSPDSVPMAVGVEVKRYKRQCNSEASKHLKHAVALGLRAVAGLELLLLSSTNNKNTNNGIFATSAPLSSLQERIRYWDRVEQQSSTGRKNASNNNDDDISGRTILDSFHVGPNQADLDLTDVLKCPVFPEEAQNWTSFSNPQSSLRDQIKGLLGSKMIDNDGQDEHFWVPRPDQVDGEDWLDCEPGKEDGASAIESQQGLDSLLSRFQSFLTQTSDVEGISSSNERTTGTPLKTADADTDARIEIRPRIFLNILHSVLQGDKLEFPTIDPFFYQEDYDAAEEGGVNDSESDSDNDNSSDDARINDEGPFQMKDLMNAMDKELEERTESRRIPATTLDGSEIDGNTNHDREGVKGTIDADANILNNLIESLGASGGGSGPVVNILKEMEGSG